MIADDHPIMRSALRMLFDSEPTFSVVAEAGTIEETFEWLQTKPDILLLDIYMPGGPALGRIRELREASPQTRIIVLTMQTSPGFAREALRLGASGYMTKQAADTELIRAVKDVASGHDYVESAVGAEIAAMHQGPAPPCGLSYHEAELLRLIALGYTAQEISELQGQSVRTICEHRRRLQRRLNACTRADLVRFALDSGLAGVELRAI